MKPIAISVLLGISLAGVSLSSLADDHHEATRDRQSVESGLRSIAHAADAGQPAHGWRYFSDARQHRAVVISPAGDYYYSHGEGLTRVYRATDGVRKDG